MAPHALTDHHDTSGYSPATVPFEKWLQDSKSSVRSKTLTPNMGSVILNSASDSSKTGDPLSQYVWRLSLHEIKDIESSIEDFQCTPHRSFEGSQQLTRLDQPHDCRSTLSTRRPSASPNLSDQSCDL